MILVAFYAQNFSVCSSQSKPVYLEQYRNKQTNYWGLFAKLTPRIFALSQVHKKGFHYANFSSLIPYCMQKSLMIQ